MNGKFIDPARNDASESKNTMMDLWQESIRRGVQQRTTVTPKNLIEQQADLLRRVRSGEIECPTCAERQFVDQSNDQGVSFSTPKGMNAAMSMLTVISHENEHVANAKADAREQNDENVVNSSIAIEKSVCPMCGKTYVSGGSATTKTHAPSLLGNAMDRREDIERILSPLQTFHAKA